MLTEFIMYCHNEAIKMSDPAQELWFLVVYFGSAITQHISDVISCNCVEGHKMESTYQHHTAVVDWDVMQKTNWRTNIDGKRLYFIGQRG